MNDAKTPESLGLLLRHTLHTVADTLTEDEFTTTRADNSRKPHRRRRILVGLGAVAIPVVLAAGAGAAILREGPEYVDTIPPQDIVMRGSVDGSRYLLRESDRTDECGRPVTGVELVEEKKNLLGSEWNTTGHEYGEYAETECGLVNDTSRYLKNPALFNDSGAEVGDSFVWVYAVHPDVTAVRITSDGYTKDLKVYEIDGAGYAPFEVPEDMNEYTAELLIDGRVFPGSEEVQKVPRP
ncbi:hypothetical protein G5C66_16880 [Nocardioides sp. KC13]|uniref:Uncharacterized protein n=1 Tax=Nocardioides turkmenicus TaxID=2711220 RepID=A0A6M1R9Y2_9ACTN|nr:hypothetical protein [Nocardioides sp. KC13]NGN94408.1 hypothetical protein [Nocardioides sp. KC13]